MTKQEFLSLETNKSSVAKLKTYALELFKNNETVEQNWFFMECAQYLQSYLSLPNSIKRVSAQNTTESFFNMCQNNKELGYRKELVLPIW